MTKRKLWWTGDNPDDAANIIRDLAAKGCDILKVDPDEDVPRVKIIFALESETASAVLGYPVEEEEWLVED